MHLIKVYVYIFHKKLNKMNNKFQLFTPSLFFFNLQTIQID